MKFKKLAIVFAALLMTLTMAGSCPADVTSLADLKTAKVGTLSGSVSEGFVRELLGENSSGQLLTYERIADIIDAVKNGKIDAGVMDAAPARYFVEKDPEKLAILPEALDTQEYAIAFRKGDTAFSEPVNKALAELKADGTLATILKRYQDGEPPAVDFNRGAAGGRLWVGCDAGLPPYDIRTENSFAGIDVELCAAIAKKLDRELTMVDYPFEALSVALAEGRIDMICSAYIVTEGRKQSMDFSEPYDADREVVVIRKGD